MRWFYGWLLLLVGLSFATAGAQDLDKAKGDKTGRPSAEPPPYNEKADARADLRRALRQATKNNRRVLIQWGGNWCPWCVLLHRSLDTDPQLRRELLYEYDYVLIDIGRRDRNMDLAKQYRAVLSDGVPYLTVLDSDGAVISNQRTDPFETTEPKGHDARKLLAFLTKHEARPPDAEKVLRSGLEESAKTGRLAFVHFGAPWCGWCKRLERWMDQPPVAAALTKGFVDVQIDIDRMKGGKEILERYNPKGTGGVPWFAFLDAKGKALATSDGPKGNIGFPYVDDEIEHFMTMLQVSRPRLAAGDLETIRTSLKNEQK